MDLFKRMRQQWDKRAGRRPTGIIVAGRFDAILTNPDGSLADHWRYDNAAVTVGLNYLLGAGFIAVTQVTTWYIRLINTSAFSAVSPTDTMASHPGWTEMVNYTGGTAPAWSPGTASAGQVSSTTATSFTIGGGGGAIQGMFLASDNTKGGTSGTLWATALEPLGARSLAAAQNLQVFYTNTMTPVS